MGVWALWLADAARSTGYPVIESAGWKTRGVGGRPMRLCEGVVGHHTATPAHLSGDYPSLRVVRDGRAGLSGPLSHLGLGRSGTIYVIAAGLCYHAGASRHDGFVDLNDEYLGVEAEHDGSGAWTAAQLDCYPKLVAALLRYMNRGVDRYASHRTVAVPAGRKPDPAKIADQWMRDRALVHLAGGAFADRHTVVPGDTLWSLSRRYGVTVEQLRRWNGLGSDLLVVGQVLRVVAPAPEPPPPPPPPASVVRDLRRGMRGEDVRRLQRVLGAWYGAIAIDGIFGPQTEAAVKRVQANVPPQPRLVADGICGPLTRRKLGLPG